MVFVGDALALPYFAAAAWYQKVLPADLRARDLKDLLPQDLASANDDLRDFIRQATPAPNAPARY